MDSASIVIAGYGFALPGARTGDELVAILRDGRTAYESFLAERIDPDIYFDPRARTGDARVSSLKGGMLVDAAETGAGVTRAWLFDVLDRALSSAGLSRAMTAGQAAPIFLANSRGGGPALYDAMLLAAAGDLLPCLAAGAHPEEFDEGDISAIVTQARASLAASLKPGMPGERALHHLPAALARELGTTGKAMIVDGNCTGGLIALDMAAFEVACGAPFAIAGALSYVDALNQVIYSNARLLASEGCYPYLDDGAGTVISDGVVLLIVTRLETAQARGWPIHGVVRGIGGANDGARERYMLTPHPRGHALAIARAHERAGLAPTAIDFYLTHGSGTRVGDLIEVEVFDHFIRAGGGAPQPIPLLSIKGHVGHAKEVAGLANLVAALALFEAGTLFDPVQPEGARTSFAQFEAIQVGPGIARDERAPPRRAGVSAIASGGQNYHAIIEAVSGPLALATSCVGQHPSTFEPMAIVGLAASFADAPDVGTLWRRLKSGHAAFTRQRPSAIWHTFADEAAVARAWAREHPGLYTDFGAKLTIDPNAWRRRAASFGERPVDIRRHDPLHYLMVELARGATRTCPIPRGGNVAVVLAAEHCSAFGQRQVVAARLPEIERHLGAALTVRGRDSRETQRTLRAALQEFRAELPDLSPSSLFNISPSFIAARIARAFDLTGPICAVEAGGGSSFAAALEIAAKRLADREVETVLCASADIRLSSSRYAEECALGHLSRSEAPCAFTIDSDGYLPGEGASVFVLRRLVDAEAVGDRVLGVIRGIGCGFAPEASPADLVSTVALERAIHMAHERAGTAPEEIGFIEGFGCGVPASDRAEVAAVKGGYRTRTATLPLGSIMPNIGHCGASACAASMVKALLALEHGELPATRGVKSPSYPGAEGVRLVETTLAIPGARLAGVNAASPGGTHYHIVLEGGMQP
jgi:acyl transferase domain-containing protein